MSRPLIGVVAYRLAPGRITGWRVGGYGVPGSYVDAVRRAGGRPVLILPGEDAEAAELLEPFEGLLLVGGGDVEPRRYGQEPHAAIGGLEPDRDDLEIRLLREADRTGIPTLAICRGAQVLNVAFGGTLIQHLPDVPGFGPHDNPTGGGSRTHDVRFAPGSRIAEAIGAEVLSCSTRHHQAVDRLGKGLIATGWSDDGLAEALERQEGWMVAAQWHPEDTAAEDRAQQRLFDAFIDRARALTRLPSFPRSRLHEP